ncbi:hypothetical protein Ahy_Scaffold1g107286 [Arachis hypogaea]|uniref:Protein FAR1-RELATED SEQUENCE n=1 Tax=Arachis hypogaea TaxID=3818 RepID=A0A444WV76_ARAHY|nr:hypothetical protein Ahy_Scaffold1g107286 [Arachis hypogaea]
MLEDYEIFVFKHKWVQLIEKFGVEDKSWVKSMYEEKHIWTTAYIKELSQDVKVYTQLCQKHFQKCVAHLRFKEINVDHVSTCGVSVMQTYIKMLERFVVESFFSRARSMQVLNIENNDNCSKYIVRKHRRPNFLWMVEFRQERMIFTCSCLRMESFKIPCKHIVKVLIDRDICKIPWSLTKKVKSAFNNASGFTKNVSVISRQSVLMEFFKQLTAVATKVPEKFEEIRNIIMKMY